jgi:hypothetical protein
LRAEEQRQMDKTDWGRPRELSDWMEGRRIVFPSLIRPFPRPLCKKPPKTGPRPLADQARSAARVARVEWLAGPNGVAMRAHHVAAAVQNSKVMNKMVDLEK